MPLNRPQFFQNQQTGSGGNNLFTGQEFAPLVKSQTDGGTDGAMVIQLIESTFFVVHKRYQRKNPAQRFLENPELGGGTTLKTLLDDERLPPTEVGNFAPQGFNERFYSRIIRAEPPTGNRRLIV